MGRKTYRACLAIAIIVVAIIGVIYYSNYKKNKEIEKDATLVQYEEQAEYMENEYDFEEAA